MDTATENGHWKPPAESTVVGLRFSRTRAITRGGQTTMGCVRVQVKGEWHWGGLLPEHITESIAQLLALTLDLPNTDLTDSMAVIVDHLETIKTELARRVEANK